MGLGATSKRLLRWLLLIPAVILLAILVMIVGWLIAGVIPAVGEPSSATVETSVAGTVGGYSSTAFGGCRSVDGNRTQRCWISDRSHSSAAQYRIEMRGRRCWHARRLSPWGRGEGTVFPRTVEGCASLQDQVDDVLDRWFGT